jgi:hypothetical protein
MTPQQRRIPILLYVPNILGYIRIIFAFIGLYYSILQQPIIAIIIWILASVLDMFDGILARLLHQTSQIGILLDIIADNILRTIIYIATCNAASVTYYLSTITTTTNDESTLSSQSSTTIIIIISCLIICTEWITMISTQLYTVYHSTSMDTGRRPPVIHTVSSSKTNEELLSPHWKKIVTTNTTNTRPQEKEWWIIQYYFSNNFCNPIGILGIYGLFASNLFLYGCYYPIVYNHIPYYNVWMYLAFMGRWLSFGIELKFCYRFIQYMIQREDK